MSLFQHNHDFMHINFTKKLRNFDKNQVCNKTAQICGNKISYGNNKFKFTKFKTFQNKI